MLRGDWLEPLSVSRPEQTISPPDKGRNINMKRRLRVSQKLAFPYVLRTQHPATWLEMRLGKCLLAIRRSKMYIPQNRKDGLLILIVAPNSALGSWETELELEGESDVVFLQGTKEQRQKLLAEKHKWNLINKEGHRALPEIADVRWDSLIVDESTFIKNPTSKVTKFFTKNFRDVPHRWSLTGCPNPQGDLDLFEQLRFLYGEAFGCRNFWQFRAKFFEPARYGYGWQPKLDSQTKIKTWLAEHVFILHRKDVNSDVPKVYEQRTLTLPRKLRKTYDELEADFLLEVSGEEVKRTKYAPVAFQWMRQLCGGFINEELVWDGKLKVLVSLLSGELANEPVVIWFSYNKALHAAYQYLLKHDISCRWAAGVTKPADRRKFERDFAKGKFRVALLQTKIAETGFNLSVSDTAIYHSVPLGTQARVQTEDRILAVDKPGPLLIIDLIVKDSVDDAVLETLTDKRFKGHWTLRRVFQLIQKRRQAS